jgi:hypothetical protein
VHDVVLGPGRQRPGLADNAPPNTLVGFPQPGADSRSEWG